MRQIEEKRLVFVSADCFDGFVGEVVGQIAVGGEAFTIVKTSRIGQYSPLNFFYNGKIATGIYNIGIIDGKVKPAFHKKAFIEALCSWTQKRVTPKMPFADMKRTIAVFA